MPLGRPEPCPACNSHLQLGTFACGWLGRYGSCPHCNKKLALAFKRKLHDWSYNGIYLLTWLYAALAAEEFSHHFANPDSILSRLFWSFLGLMCAMLPGYRVSAWFADKWGTLIEDDIKSMLRR